MTNSRVQRVAVAIAATLTIAGCRGGGVVPSPSAGESQSTARAVPDKESSILKTLKKEVVIGSTVDPVYGQLNPYGLTVAPATTGDFTKGDLVVCNFNDKKNVQGTGFTIVALHPKPGSKPTLVSHSKTLVGCDALALGPADDIWAAAFSADDNPIISASGKLEGNIKGKPFNHPFGQIFAQPTSGSAAFYESNAGVGTVVRINLGSKFTFDVIARGFAVNHGKPGSIFAPSGLAYDASIDTLYIVDGTNNTVVAFSKVSTIPNGGIIVEKGGLKFKGPSAGQARVLFAGAPLNGPISSALLANGNLVVGNTTNPSGQNIMVELSRSGKVLATRNVDKGAPGSIFGMVATGKSAADTKLYFNDDNNNDLRVLER
ncbi:MAG: hypothetical protein JO190_03880 [Candidatus Eremiobacteraeota bacterium]|nr:hypothetical protein [Candidatus Eremiobacteraeota bacterium]MBV8498653.1 hypothetical protein [Candidatus Eremiobacteraeota bacterium]